MKTEMDDTNYCGAEIQISESTNQRICKVYVNNQTNHPQKVYLLGLAGKMRTGKNTVANIVHESLESMFDKTVVVVHQISFAKKLKQMVAGLLGYRADDEIQEYIKRLESTEFKNSPSGIIKDGVDLTHRQLLQTIGQMIRDIYPMFWVDALDRDVEHLVKTYAVDKDSDEDPIHVFIITDVRYENEIMYIQTGGDVVKIDRNGDSDDEDPIHNHPSESFLNDNSDHVRNQFTVLIDNNGTIKDLEDCCHEVIIKRVVCARLGLDE